MEKKKKITAISHHQKKCKKTEHRVEETTNDRNIIENRIYKNRIAIERKKMNLEDSR